MDERKRYDLGEAVAAVEDDASDGGVPYEVYLASLEALTQLRHPESEYKEEFRVVKVNERARVPSRQSIGSAGFDLYTLESTVVRRGKPNISLPD